MSPEYAGEAHNIIPETCLLRGTLRSMDAGVRRSLREDFESLVRHTAATHGVDRDMLLLQGVL